MIIIATPTSFASDQYCLKHKEKRFSIIGSGSGDGGIPLGHVQTNTPRERQNSQVSTATWDWLDYRGRTDGTDPCQDGIHATGTCRIGHT